MKSTIFSLWDTKSQSKLAGLVFVVLFFGACTTINDPITISLDITSATEIGLASNDKHFYVKVTNSTDNEATISWERSETQAVTGWTYTIDGNSATTGTLVIPPNSTLAVQLLINPNNIVDNGTGILKFYDSSAPVTTMKAFSYNLTTVIQYFTVQPLRPLSRTISIVTASANYPFSVKNPNLCPITVEWKRTAESQNPSSWSIYLFDEFNTYPPSLTERNITLPPGDSIELGITIMNNATAGTGGSTPIFYVASDSLNSVIDTHVTNLTVTP